ncbi:MAG TPA: hypothetical protein VNA14_02890 [Mycobacteriales bacterium]|nr:hypothetical protein [Mycobacteriales bacterium]
MASGGAGGDPAAEIAALIDHIATRLRRFGSRHWRDSLGPAGESAAELVWHAIVWCARAEAELDPGRPPNAPRLPERAAYDAALADQLAVVGRDLAMSAVHADQSHAEALLAHLRQLARTLKVESKP